MSRAGKLHGPGPAGQSVANTGASFIAGDLGVSPGTTITGFLPGLVSGARHSADAVALQAQSDLTTAYNNAAGQSPATAVPTELGGQTLPKGIYNNGTGLGMTGRLTLEGQNDPNSVFVFQAGPTLITASNSTVALINGVQACNVFWQVGSPATVGTGTTFVGDIMALTSIPLGTGATTAPPTTTTTAPPTTTARPRTTTRSPQPRTRRAPHPTTTHPAGGNGPGPGGGPGSAAGWNGSSGSSVRKGAGSGGDTGSSGQPVVPSGHPETDAGSTAQFGDLPLALGGALFLAAMTTMGQAFRLRRRS